MLDSHNFVRISFLHALALRNKNIPSVLADSEGQENVSCFMYSNSVFLKDPIRNAKGFLLLSFEPDIDLKASNILMSSLNDLKEPSSQDSIAGSLLKIVSEYDQ